jgi:hypothetical protein
MIQYFPIVTGSLTVLGNINVSGSITTSGSITISGSITSASFATSASNATNAISASYANNLTVAGTLTAQTLVVQTVTSSVIYSSGSNVFGNNVANTQVLTGSVNITGSLAVITNGTEFQVTNTGVKFGNVIGDAHSITGSVGISGSATFVNNVTSNNMFINTTDNSSGAKLQISGSINFKSNSGYNGWVISQAGGSSAAAFNLSYGAGGASNVITAQYDNGFVGIGTPSPQAKFELSGSSGNFQIASSGAEVFFTRNDNNDLLANGGSSAGIRFGGQSQLRFATGTGLSTRLTIDVSGNIIFNNVAAQVQWEGGNYWTWRTVTSGTEFWLYRGDTGATPFIVTTGNVVRLSSLAGSGTRTVTADASGNLSASSDSSLKQEDTTHTIEGLAEVLQLKPRAYKWLSDIEIRGEEATTEIGFFANEVNSIIPSAAPKGNDDLYGFYDRAVIAALVKALQELNTKFEEYKATHP